MKTKYTIATSLVLASVLLACGQQAVTPTEHNKLVTFANSLEMLAPKSASTQVKQLNVAVDEIAQTIYLPLNLGTDLTAFDPEFILPTATQLQPVGPQDFSQGPVDYSFSQGTDIKTYRVFAQAVNNPIVEGYYADPEIIYSQKHAKYFLYPTSDGFHGWSGTHFETFSSTDLVEWRKEGTILDLTKDVSWANRNAWAPSAIEKRIDGQYKYFHYFTAAQKIGVAVADHPAGPFVDSGKPLIDFKPEGITWGQEIDPDVFTDPISGKSYLYWGNGYMAVAELNADMQSIKKSTIKVMTPDSTFREGVEVFFRNNKYYFLWSENDTREPGYRVRYATADSPLGPLTIPADNLVIEQDKVKQIFATGHNSVINKAGTDDWYIIYHRFNRPNGLVMGGDAGFHREVCIDKLVFNADGSIRQTKPTLEGLTY
ncbi:family 43 glycosylhydrolase [Catenovulum agarivorans]|uniref:family 43 glycosylhydrolase n=1 Tax=Catenovulum agarivorans TaxID=1172192 RepID=UPI00192B3204|nr:family 43 glycosylhydrolase [Catenovulum agarivorans]